MCVCVHARVRVRGPTWSYPLLEAWEEVSVSKSTLVFAPSGRGVGERKYCPAPRLPPGAGTAGWGGPSWKRAPPRHPALLPQRGPPSPTGSACGRRPGCRRPTWTGPTRSLRQGHQHLHVAEGEEARLAVEHALVPVLVDLVGQRDDVTLVEAQLPGVLGLEVVQSLAARLVQRGWGWGLGSDRWLFPRPPGLLSPEGQLLLPPARPALSGRTRGEGWEWAPRVVTKTLLGRARAARGHRGDRMTVPLRGPGDCWTLTPMGGRAAWPQRRAPPPCPRRAERTGSRGVHSYRRRGGEEGGPPETD